MEYKVIINGNKYKIPELVSELNKDTIFNNYTLEKENEKYLDIEKLIKENKKDEICKICNQTGHYFTMLTEGEQNQEFKEMFQKINFLSNFAEYCFKEGKINQGLEKKLEELEISLKSYNKIIEDPEEITKSR